MKRNWGKIALVLVILLVWMCSAPVSAADKDAILQDQTNQSGAGQLLQQAPAGARSTLRGLGINGPDAESLSRLTPARLFDTLLGKLGEAAKAPIRAVGAVFGILLACALLETMKNSFGEKPLKNVFALVCTLGIAAVILTPVIGCIRDCARTLQDSSRFMLTFLPVFAALVTASGHPASALAFQSVMLVSSQVIAQIAATTFLPMVNLYLAFCVVGSVSPGVHIGSIAAFIRKITNYFLVLCITLFTGLLTVQGLIAQAADTVTVKTAKFLVGSFVPVIGSAVSDALNTVVSCANLLKTTTGVFAIVIFTLTFLPPLLECLLWMLAADLSVAVAEVLGVESVAGLLKSVKEALRLLTALVLTAALAMIISVTVMLLLGMGS